MDKPQDGEGWKARTRALRASLALSYSRGNWGKLLSRGQNAASSGPSHFIENCCFKVTLSRAGLSQAQ